MEKVLITGGAGFIGYHLAQRLLKKGYEITLLDDFSRGVNDSFLQELSGNNRVKLINDDLVKNDVVEQLASSYTYIYHLAAVIGVRHVRKAPYDVLVKNVVLLKNALTAAEKQISLKRFVFTSTSEVYAGTLKHIGLEIPTPERTPLCVTDLNESRSTYMMSKIYGEAMCHHSAVPVTIVRPHNLYGPRMGFSHVIPELLKKAYESEDGSLEVYSVHHKRTFCFIKDAVEMIVILAEHERSVGETYNVGNEDDEFTISDLAHIILDVVGRDIKIKPLPPTPGSPERRCPDMTKTFDVTGYRTKHMLNDGIKKTFDWYRHNIFERAEVSAI